jgi:hypothetical protein
VREAAKVKGQTVQGGAPANTANQNTEQLVPQPKMQAPPPEGKKQ